MNAPHRILVGIDGSEPSRRAVAWAAREARERRSELFLLHVWQLPAALAGDGALSPGMYDEVRANAQAIVDEAEAAAREAGVADVGAEARFGQTTPVLLAETRDADLLVLGTRGYGRLRGMFLGSVSQYLTAHAACPVVVVRGEGEAGEVEPVAPEPVALDEISPDECRALLGSATFGRLAVVRDGRPQIFTVNYVLDGTTVTFRTGPGTKLEWSTMAPVAFEVDDVDPATHEGWTVEVRGVGRDLTAGADARSAHLRAVPLEPWVEGEHEHWVAIADPVITGRRLRGRQRGPSPSPAGGAAAPGAVAGGAGEAGGAS